jgi:hypothetical protein
MHACQQASDCCAPHTGQWRPDPRTGELGQRALLPKSADPALEADAATADEAAYRQWRVERGVAEGDSEIPSGQCLFALHLIIIHVSQPSWQALNEAALTCCSARNACMSCGDDRVKM